jgi:ketosteroid isomerase-like protein
MVAVLALSSVVTAVAVTPVSAPRVVTMKMLVAHNKAFMARDLNGLMALYGPRAVVVDHSAPRVFIGQAAIRGWFKTIFAQPGKITGVYKLLTAGRDGRVVWFTSQLTSSLEHKGRTITAKLRLSGVLVKKAGAWQVAQIHLSTMPRGSN